MVDRQIVIQVIGLSKTFAGRGVLKDVGFEVRQGESVAITGANGSGKTTLLRLLASSLRPSAGRVMWFGRPAGLEPSSRRLIAMVSHESALYPHLTLRENLIFAARMYDVRRPAHRADELLAGAGLQADAHRSPERISKGMRQRLSLARAMVHDPRILLLDEPFAGLDAEGTEWLFEVLRDLSARQCTVCFTIHDERKLRRLAERVLHLRSGRLEEVKVSTVSASLEYRKSARAA